MNIHHGSFHRIMIWFAFLKAFELIHSIQSHWKWSILDYTTQFPFRYEQWTYRRIELKFIQNPVVSGKRFSVTLSVWYKNFDSKFLVFSNGKTGPRQNWFSRIFVSFKMNVARGNFVLPQVDKLQNWMSKVAKKRKKKSQTCESESHRRFQLSNETVFDFITHRIR